MKWLENSTSIAAAVEKWDKTPVDVVPIDTAGVAALRKNGTKKVRLFNVLRGSRQTELTEKFPAHVVSFWLSNTPRVAVQHYLQVRDSDFERAKKRGSSAAKSCVANRRRHRKTIARGAERPRNHRVLRQIAIAFRYKLLYLVPPTGVEPVTFGFGDRRTSVESTT
jgi:hypothetical protein